MKSLLSVMVLTLVLSLAFTQQPPNQPKQTLPLKPPVLQPEKKPVVEVKGGVQIVPVDKLPKFKTPVPIPPKTKPPEKEGGRWHWHPHYGWCHLPLAIAPTTIVLPPTFVLPPTVTFYQLPIQPQPLTMEIVCPHCGQPLRLTISH